MYWYNPALNTIACNVHGSKRGLIIQAMDKSDVNAKKSTTGDTTNSNNSNYTTYIWAQILLWLKVQICCQYAHSEQENSDLNFSNSFKPGQVLQGQNGCKSTSESEYRSETAQGEGIHGCLIAQT